MSGREIGSLGPETSITIRWVTVERLRALGGSYDSAISWLLSQVNGNAHRATCGSLSPRDPSKTCRRAPRHEEPRCKWWSRTGEVLEWRRR